MPAAGQTFPVQTGDIVYWRNTAMDLLYWHPGRVDAVEGDTLHLTLSSGEKVDGGPGQYVPQKKE